uniref:Integral membrane protein 2 n=1 Tax=Sus scrofa TaxID=9823 RepID=A0A8D1KSA3_PIG
MVKISFQPAVAGIKGDKADKASASASAPAPAPAAEILLTPAREERPPHHRYKKGSSVGGVCYLSMGMVVLLMGLVFASVYIYRYFFLAQLARDNFFHCGVLYEDSLSSQARTRMELEEDVKIYLEENYERINVPVPQFGGGDPADIIHDFQRGLTAYHDISLDKCYVIELNTTIVLPPRNFWELLMNVKGDLPPADLHHPGGDGGHGARQRQGGPGLLHLPPVQREGHLPAAAQGHPETDQQTRGQELQRHPPLREHLRGGDAHLRGGVKPRPSPQAPPPPSFFPSSGHGLALLPRA